MNLHSFITAIQAEPDNEIPRLVYADWLDEQGDPRGELIRIQCEIARRPSNDEKRKRLEDRASELLQDYGDEWLEPLREYGPLGVTVRCFRRGLIEHLKISAEDFLKHAETLCEIEPALTAVQLTNISHHWDEFGKTAFPAPIKHLDVSANQLAAIECQYLAGSLIRNQIVTLDLKFNRLEDDAVIELGTTEWPQLERLDLSSNRIGPNGAATLARQSAFPKLKSLHLGMNRIQDGGLSAPLRSNTFQKLEELNVASNAIGNASVETLLSLEGVLALKSLSLRYNQIGIAEQKRLQESRLNARLESLDLTGNIRPSSYQ